MIQDFFHLFATVQQALYRGDNERAHRYVEERASAIRFSPVSRSQILRIIFKQSHARATLAVAAERPTSGRGKLLSRARKIAGELESEKVEWARHQAAMIRSAVAHIEGDLDGARSLMASAAREFDALGMGLYAAAARRRWGEIMAGDKGRELVSEANLWMSAQGIVNAERMTAMLAPGFAERR